MAEHALSGPVIGLSLDGTGYGLDGHIWGGEVLVCKLDRFERFAHLDYVPMPGGESAIREPWRMAFSHLHAAGIDPFDPAIRDILGANERKARVLARMIERGLNAPLTSSCGRLFDAVAAILLRRREVDYEAQAAVELEGLAVDVIDAPVPFASYEIELCSGDWARLEPIRMSVAPLWRGLLEELQQGRDHAGIAARFHSSIAAGFVQAVLRARTVTNVGQVALSGGCMHNRRLGRLLRVGLEAAGLEVFAHRRVSPGDGGLSYGQAVVGAAILESEQE
jgi:hydrogenase maturation protein HypF